MTNLISAFNTYFEIVTADTPALREQAFRLRYEVYVKEMQWESGEADIETDAYDACAVHSLMYHRPTAALAGTVRLILADPDHPYRPLPAENLISESARLGFGDRSGVSRHQSAEVSRFTLARQFRSRFGESVNPYGAPLLDTASVEQAHNRRKIDDSLLPIEQRSGHERRLVLHPMLGLIRCVLRMSAHCKLAYWYIVAEPALERQLGRFGLRFEPISPPVQYHGLRRVFEAYIPSVLTRLHEGQREIWTLVTDEGKSCASFE